LGWAVQKVGLFFERLFSRPSPKVSYRRSATDSSTRGNSTSTATAKKDATSQEEVDKILDKIAEKGYEGLSKEEKRKLFEFSKK
jgi:hypothetical protein